MRVYLAKHHSGAFDPQTITVLVEALDDAWAAIQASGARLESDEDARNAVAKIIVNLALQGERDRQRLVARALERFGL